MTDYILHLADNALILGHRNSEWTGHGPILEQDIALSNISLDLIGQARHLYQYAAELLGDGSTEDKLAYFRGPEAFKNCMLVEQPKGHWGTTVLRQFLFSAYQYPLYQQLASRDDEKLAAIAQKSLKEVTYHLRWSSEWVIRLGQGTETSNDKMKDAVKELWPYTQDLLTRTDGDLQFNWQDKVQNIFSKASLALPADVTMITGENHRQHLVEILSEMQHLQRTYPNVEW